MRGDPRLASAAMPLAILALTAAAVAFAVAILGGLTSAWGVMLAGLAYGLIEAMATAYLGSVYTQIVAFSVVILALTAMPNGLFGRAAVNKV